MPTLTTIEQAIQFDTLDERVAAERTSLVAGLRALADRLEAASLADATEHLTALHGRIAALLTDAAPWIGSRPR